MHLFCNNIGQSIFCSCDSSITTRTINPIKKLVKTKIYNCSVINKYLIVGYISVDNFSSNS
jgi:hypothetical protein